MYVNIARFVYISILILHYFIFLTYEAFVYSTFLIRDEIDILILYVCIYQYNRILTWELGTHSGI